MKSVMQSIGALIRLAFTTCEPQPHPIAHDVERAAERSERESRRVDEFAALVHGMRGMHKAKKKSGRATRRRI